LAAQQQDRQYQQRHRRRGREMRFRRRLKEAPDLGRDDMEAGRQGQDRRCAELGQRLHESDEGSGQQGRQHHRQGDPPQRMRAAGQASGKAAAQAASATAAAISAAVRYGATKVGSLASRVKLASVSVPFLSVTLYQASQPNGSSTSPHRNSASSTNTGNERSK